jgi:hypothetical protein
MKSQTATKILYDDPNSFFRASRRVALHELQGATLRTKKPSSEDIKQGLISSSILISLLNDLDAIDTRLIPVVSMITAQPPVYMPIELTGMDSKITEILKYIGLSSGDIKRLKKSTSPLSEEDLSAITTIMEAIIEKFTDIMSVDVVPENQELLNSPIVLKLETELRKMLDQLKQLVELKTSSIRPGESPMEQPNIDEIPPDMEGAGHFKVLSSRMRHIQKSNYKRFL